MAERYYDTLVSSVHETFELLEHLRLPWQILWSMWFVQLYNFTELHTQGTKPAQIVHYTDSCTLTQEMMHTLSCTLTQKFEILVQKDKSISMLGLRLVCNLYTVMPAFENIVVLI